MSRAALARLIIGTSAYYGQKLDDGVVGMYVEDLEDLPYEHVVRALQEIRRDPKVSRFPLPAVIRARLLPPESDEDLAREASARIASAVTKFGWCNPSLAREYIGSLGWSVVDRQGGWVTICETLTTDNSATFQAQWRELAAALCRMSKRGDLEKPPALPGHVNKLIGWAEFPE